MSQECISSSLFHFTSDINILKLIITNGPRLSYSFESLSENDGFLIPMICFCDIPFDCQTKHKQDYGNFGVGFSKDYLRKEAKFSNLLNPILYGSSTEINSSIQILRNSYELLLNRCADLGMDYTHFLITGKDAPKLSDELELSFKLWQSTRLLIGYWKPYEDSNGTYYQEREWRIIVPDGISDLPWIHKSSKPSKEERVQLSAKKFNNNKMTFLTIPIEHFVNIDSLIVPDENSKNDITEFILTTPQLFGSVLTPMDSSIRDMLIDKILIP